jgi:predicted Mrr-cat superfamily restriction endonuclease
MKSYYQVRLGKGGSHAEECFAGGFIGADFQLPQDLAGRLPDDWRAFNKEFVPLFLDLHPDKTKVVAGLACGALWTLAKGLINTDIVVCPDGTGRYRVGEVTGDYFYKPDGVLPHRRPVHWFGAVIARSDMTQALRSSTNYVGTVGNISAHREELERLMGGAAGPTLIVADPTVEDPWAFAMEKHLEDFLVQNWAQTELGKEFDIYQEDGEQVGQQYPSDTGPLDILAISKDKKRLLVVELKRGRASDAVVGQVMRYMGFVKEDLAEPGQSVHGAIIALEDDQRIRRALSVVPNIVFYRYQLGFKLVKA